MKVPNHIASPVCSFRLRRRRRRPRSGESNIRFRRLPRIGSDAEELLGAYKIAGTYRAAPGDSDIQGALPDPRRLAGEDAGALFFESDDVASEFFEVLAEFFAASFAACGEVGALEDVPYFQDR